MYRSLRQLLSPLAPPKTSTSLEHIYAAVESLVHFAKQGPQLYEKLQEEAERASVEVARLLKNVNTKEPFAWLQALEEHWKSWSKRAETAKSVLSHLDSGYVLYQRDQASQTSLEVLMTMFKRNVIEDAVIHAKALESITRVIDEERQVASTSTSTMTQPSTYAALHPSILSLFLRLHAYNDLQAAVIDSTQRFYATEATDWVASSSDGDASSADKEAGIVESYLTHAQQRLDKEAERAEWLLHSRGDKKTLVDTVRSELVKNRAEWLTAGLPALLEQEAPPIGSLSLLFKHLASVDQLKILSAAFVTHIIKGGAAIVTPPSADILNKTKGKAKKTPSDEEKQALRDANVEEAKIIERLLEFKAKVDSTVDVAFEGHDEFRQRRKEAFEKVVNSRSGGAKVAELCAKYLDAKLRQGNKAMTDEELQHCLDEALALFRWTHAKDMFEEFYKRYFAKRLLLNKSASSDFEQMMLLRLKDECGPAFTQRLETMLKDITLSDDLMKAYGERKAKARDDGNDDDVDPFDMQVNVLTQAHWPAYPTVNVQIPPAMAMATQRFETFYDSRTSGRKLFWAHSLGMCTLTARFKHGDKELMVSEFQAIVLLLFNDLGENETISYASIAEQTGLEEKELKRTLTSLASGKKNRVLRKEPQGAEIDVDKDVFRLNAEFKSPSHRVRINQIQMQETSEEQESTESRVLLDRELVLQAATVRIMKAKKQLKHTELLQEVVNSIKARFQIDVGEIKKQFEILIEKEYMERVEGERSTYRYLA